ncbi:MerR family transcriptional regulator [Siminovitchia acidinfaciens]|uniref:MerR family transcriptional regulator n=1 Tax=Siminovitchia acidinfaciens TaxID=2321395 RepID=A0A429XZ51_9BACI|nr:MerR family transcriptional regulator [Siminovitchia acidinfaciens]RST74060.1 MerR family transcriptional regulator [Siminovitchia acidinfaciens]
MENLMYTSGAAKALGLGVSTLRNYAVVLESKGYHFERGSNNGRIFREKDISQIQEMIDRMAEDGVTVEQAAEITAGQSGKIEVLLDVPSEKMDLELKKLCEKITLLEQQQTNLAEINRKLAVQVERLTEKIEERERDQQLFEMMENARNKKKRKGMAFLRFTFSDKKSTI